MDKDREAAIIAWMDDNGGDRPVPERQAFLKGYDARDVKTCVWGPMPNESEFFLTQCGAPIKNQRAIFPFCPACGGRITEAK